MNDVDNAVKLANSLWEQLTHAPSHLLALVVLMFFGMLIKKSPVPNWTIPWVLISVGVIVYPLLASPANIDPSFRHPEFVLRLYGFLLGAGAIVSHKFLTRFEWFQRIEASFVNSFRDDAPEQNKETV